MPHFLSHMKCSKIPAQSPSSYSPTGDIDWQLERDGDGAVKQISVLNIISNPSIKTECVTGLILGVINLNLNSSLNFLSDLADHLFSLKYVREKSKMEHRSQ